MNNVKVFAAGVMLPVQGETGREAPQSCVLGGWRSGPPLGQDDGVFHNSFTTFEWEGGVPSLALQAKPYMNLVVAYCKVERYGRRRVRYGRKKGKLWKKEG